MAQQDRARRRARRVRLKRFARWRLKVRRWKKRIWASSGFAALVFAYLTYKQVESAMIEAVLLLAIFLWPSERIWMAPKAKRFSVSTKVALTLVAAVVCLGLSGLAPSRARFQQPARIVVIDGPEVDPSQEQFDLDGAATVAVVPPWDESMLTLGVSLARSTEILPRRVNEITRVSQMQEVHLLGAPALFTADGRTFAVTLQAVNRQNIPGKYRSTYELRIKEQEAKLAFWLLRLFGYAST